VNNLGIDFLSTSYALHLWAAAFRLKPLRFSQQHSQTLDG